MKYQFQSNPGELSYKPTLFTNAIKVLISINFVIFILQTLSRSETLFFPLFLSATGDTSLQPFPCSRWAFAHVGTQSRLWVLPLSTSTPPPVVRAQRTLLRARSRPPQPRVPARQVIRRLSTRGSSSYGCGAFRIARSKRVITLST